VGNPDLAIEPDSAVQIAVVYWVTRHIAAAAQRDDLTAVTRLVNGGTNGLADLKAALERAKAAFPNLPGPWRNRSGRPDYGSRITASAPGPARACLSQCKSGTGRATPERTVQDSRR
jgi:hypothetical protein